MRKRRFCYKDIIYPGKLFLSCVWTINSQGQQMPFVLPRAENKIDDLFEYTNEMILLLREKIEVLDSGILGTLKLKELYPLKKEFWENSSVDVEILQRIEAFLKVMESPENYKILVTPRRFQKREIFIPSYPFLNSVEDKDIELFMKLSTEPVDERAKNAAFYTLDSLVGINWKTKEVYKADREEQVISRLN